MHKVINIEYDGRGYSFNQLPDNGNCEGCYFCTSEEGPGCGSTGTSGLRDKIEEATGTSCTAARVVYELADTSLSKAQVARVIDAYLLRGCPAAGVKGKDLTVDWIYNYLKGKDDPDYVTYQRLKAKYDPV